MRSKTKQDKEVSNPGDWRNNLPGFDEKTRDIDRSLLVHARYVHQPTKTYFYIAQAKHAGGDLWEYWGFAVIPGRSFPINLTIPSKNLETGDWLGRVRCEPDPEFNSSTTWFVVKDAHFPHGAPPRSGRLNGGSRM